MTANRIVTAPTIMSTVLTHVPGKLEQVQGDAGKEIDPEELVNARGQDCHERKRRIKRGVRNPAMERHGACLADCPDHEKDERRAAQAVHGEPDCRHRQSAGQPTREHDAEHHADVGSPQDDERLDGRAVRLAPASGNHGELRQQKSFPEEQQEDKVVGQRHSACH